MTSDTKVNWQPWTWSLQGSPNQCSQWKHGFSLLNMFNLCLYNAATIRYSQLKFQHMHLCGIDYKHFSPHCCKCNSFGYAATISCGSASHGPHSDTVYSGSEQTQFDTPRLVKHEAGFPNPGRALLGSNQLWRVIGIDTNIEVIVVSLTTWEAHHSPRAKPEGCGELPRSLMRQQWSKLRYQFLFYHDETKLIMNKQILSI